MSPLEGNVHNLGSWQSALAIAENLFAEHDPTNGVRNVKIATSGGKILGITGAKTATTNDNVPVVQGGQTHLIVNANSPNISAGDRLKSGGSGIGVGSVADDEEYGAVALEAATADGALILVDIERGTLSGSGDD